MMMLKRAALCLISSTLLLSPLHAMQWQQQQIVTTDQASAYRVTLDADSYRALDEQRVNLQLYNHAAQAIPFAWESLPQQQSRELTAQVPFFAMPPQERSASAAASTQQNHSAVAAYLLDTQALPNGDWQQLQLTFAEQQYRGQVQLHSSDDLQHWQPIDSRTLLKIADGPSNTSFPLTQRLGRYLRLDWQQQPFTLNQATLTIRQQQALELQQGDWYSAKPALQNNSYMFDLELNAPYRQLQLKLPLDNQVLSGLLSSRATTDAPWQPVQRFTARQLNQSSIRIDLEQVQRHRYWRWQLEQPLSLEQQSMPQLQGAWFADSLVFVAQGDAPYVLEIGERRQHASVYPSVSALLSQQPPLIGHATLTNPQWFNQTNPPDEITPPKTREVLLWLTLLAAVAVLAFITRQLMKAEKTSN